MKQQSKTDTQDTQDTQSTARGTIYEHLEDFNSDLEIHDNYITDFDAYEAMLISKTYDQVSRQTKNGITDGDAATMVIERAARVVGQLPDGEVVAMGKQDKGKAILMNILVQKYIYPNANAQRPFLDKIRLWEQYSQVYGVMPMYYDWDVSPSGYVGPNCWLWNPRNFIPQQGRYTIQDMEYVHAISYLSPGEIKNLLKQRSADSGWDYDNLETLLEMAKNNSHEPDTLRDTYIERQRINRSIKGRIMVVTRYEAGDDGHWISFSPDYSGLQLRDIPNPHKNGRIPFVVKPCIPLFDSFYGLSDMARAKPVQFAKDGLTNFYFQGIKMNIYPPTVVNAQGILKHTVSNEPGSIWEEIIPNSARRLETSTAGLATYQAAMGQMAGALQNIFGTTTTQINANQAMSPQFGKTPEAIKYQSGRESARDNQNRAYLQQAIEQLLDGMISLFPAMGTEEIPLDLFADDIKEIVEAGYTDVQEMLVMNESGKSARIIINPKKLKGVEYRFNMEPDSTIKQDKDNQRQSILDVLTVLGQHMNLLQDLQRSSGQMPNTPALLASYISLSDIPGVDQAFIQAPVEQDPNNNPVMKIMEALNIDYNDLSDDQKNQLLAMTLGIRSQSPSPKQQELNIKQQEVSIKQQEAAVKAVTAAKPEPQPAPAPAPVQPPAPKPAIAPQTVNGMIFHDDVLHKMATDLHGMRGAPTNATISSTHQ